MAWADGVHCSSNSIFVCCIARSKSFARAKISIMSCKVFFEGLMPSICICWYNSTAL